MIKFFRKIRQKLLSENKFSKYLIYAIGEIVLVVIGILIALQINTWNQHRLNQIEKKEIVAKLNVEFKENKKVLSDFRILESNSQIATITLIRLCGAPKDELSLHNLDSLFFESFPASDLAFANNAVNSIVQNDQLKYFKDSPIRDFLNKWNSLEEILTVRNERRDAWTNELFLPFLLPYISFREMDIHSGYTWAGESKLKPDFYPLFQRIEFENLIDNSLFLQQNVIDRLIELELLVDEIIEITNP